MKNQNNKGKKKQATTQTEKKEKVITKYDRKMEARRIQEEKEKLTARRWKLGITLTGICLVCILTG